MKFNFTFILAILLLKPISSFAWGHEGHNIVAEIAFKHLPANIADSVRHYLGNMTIEEASNWMDEVRSDKTMRYMNTWHYIDLEKDQSYMKSNFPKNIMNQLDRVINELKNKSSLSSEKTSLDLKILFHLIGDLHQPLHCGYPEDKGGNTIQVLMLSEEKNLHYVWDTGIIKYKHITAESCTKDFKYNAQQIRTIGIIDPAAWFNQSRSLLPQVYSFENNTLSSDYMDKNARIIEQQLFNAGVRLSSVLINIFSK